MAASHACLNVLSRFLADVTVDHGSPIRRAALFGDPVCFSLAMNSGFHDPA